MNAGLPPPLPPSLVERVRAGVRGLRFDRSARLATALAMLLAAGPALTILCASALEADARADATALDRASAGRHPGEAPTGLARLVAQPGIGATIEALARTLPPDAALVKVGRDPAAGLRLEIATPDPDRLRAALRRTPATRNLREVGQSSGDGAMLVALAERP